jgi:hypothetical protein
MQFGALGDIHGDFDAVERIMRRHADIPFWLTVGDVAADDGRYPAPVSPLFFIKGNNERFDVLAEIAAGGRRAPNLHYLPNGRVTRVGPLRVAALGGTFAPTWYEAKVADLPYPGRAGGPSARDDKRRHFVRDEVEALVQASGADLFLSHEAPRPFLVSTARGRNDAGKTAINEVLSALAPRLHLFGHHHRFTENERQGVRSVGLDLAARSYLLVDAVTFGYEVLATVEPGGVGAGAPAH